MLESRLRRQVWDGGSKKGPFPEYSIRMLEPWHQEVPHKMCCVTGVLGIHSDHRIHTEYSINILYRKCTPPHLSKTHDGYSVFCTEYWIGYCIWAGECVGMKAASCHMHAIFILRRIPKTAGVFCAMAEESLICPVLPCRKTPADNLAQQLSECRSGTE